ncbi:ABC transporter substrate-binding protein [Actinocatenispora comari]|uniref:ABC transporter n=1 Tax=Actinocatenispora comari TaxID=2807577 RepID=A0A8J4AE11_9ACTN|nr:ABC transporter substrate-binding protein [Actinocatenispora comari]GIL26958.1 ABC transporter [Actinocatenispora comari]
MRTGKVVAVGAVAVALIGMSTACSKNTGKGGNGDGPTAKVASGSISTDPADSKGPAAAIKGAKRGGTIISYHERDYEHLDPQRVYISDGQALDQLVTRQLTAFKFDPKTGKSILVGDLATNTGVDVNHDGKTWKYTLKSGLKYEDGTPITAADVAYGVARSYASDLADGPHYIQQWLAGPGTYNGKYKGPYNGGAAVPPGVTVSGNTITFHLKSSQREFPYAASWGTTSPLPKAKDGKPQSIDTHPFSSGPYKIESYTRGTELKLVRNKYWDPKSDPIRHDYFNELDVKIGVAPSDQTNRVLADHGDDQYAVTDQPGVSPELTGKVLGDPSAKGRTLNGYLPYAARVDINTQRVTDVNVRKALNYSIDRKAYVQALGGTAQAAPATTLMSPTAAGWNKYDAYPGAGTPDGIAKAKKLLGGKHPKLVYAYANTEAGQKLATVLQTAWQKAGFDIVLRSSDPDNFFTLIDRKDNGWDLYSTNWGADWPSGSTVIPPLYDGRTIAKAGNQDTSYLNADDVNKQIDKIKAEPVAQGTKDWGKLDEYIMTKYAPSIPTYYIKQLSITGSKVHDVKIENPPGAISYVDAWVG